MEEIAVEIEVALRRIVAKREHALRNGEATSDDLLSLLLASNMEHCKGGAGDSGVGGGITTDDVIGECR
jgi:hypothetical protein